MEVSGLEGIKGMGPHKIQTYGRAFRGRTAPRGDTQHAASGAHTGNLLMMHRSYRSVMLVLGVWAALAGSVARADPPSTQAAAPPDKSQYTLFNPVPADQLRSMQTDRPNVTNTPITVDAGHLQIETGLIDYTLTRTRTAGANVRTDDTTFGEFNFRLGVLNNLELNLVTDAYQIDRTHDYRADVSTQLAGYSDTVFGGTLKPLGQREPERHLGHRLGHPTPTLLPHRDCGIRRGPVPLRHLLPLHDEPAKGYFISPPNPAFPTSATPTTTAT